MTAIRNIASILNVREAEDSQQQAVAELNEKTTETRMEDLLSRASDAANHADESAAKTAKIANATVTKLKAAVKKATKELEEFTNAAKQDIAQQLSSECSEDDEGEDSSTSTDGDGEGS